MKQMRLLKNSKNAYGGELLKTRKGRSGPRPLATRQSMHLVLRSSKAKKKMSFLRPKNRAAIKAIVKKFSEKYGIRLYSFANVGNHLHFHIQLSNRFGYKPFIRAVTAAIAMQVTGRNRWTAADASKKEKFWDLRPFTRVITSFKAFLNLKDYVAINRMEVNGFIREEARMLLREQRRKAPS